MGAIHFILNQLNVAEQAAPGTPLLDVIRRSRRLTGCKEACREGDCGACLVLLGKVEHARLIYRPATACLVPMGAVAGLHVVTIEGLSGDELNPIQKALVDHGGIQCGFCTPGIVVALTAFFLNGTSSDADEAIDAAAGNLCRCTGYSAIKHAIRQLCRQFDLAESPLTQRIDDCVEWRLLPRYFAGIAARLAHLPVAEAIAANEEAVLVAGGSDLLVRQAEAWPDTSVSFLPAADDQACVRLAGQTCTIAPTTSIERLRTSAEIRNVLPTIADDLRLVCSAPVRQRATLGGNLANASPIADLAVLFLALDATLLLATQDQTRQVRLRDFFTGYKQTTLRQQERLLEISFDSSAALTGFSFEKVSKRQFLDIASVNSALSIRVTNGTIESVHLAAGGVAPIPLYLAAACDYLLGKPVCAEVVSRAAAIAQTEISPISDLRGSAEYKRLLFRQLLFAHFLKLFPQQISWEALHVAA